MKLSKKDIKLVKQSIKHWNEDIAKPLEEGRKVVKGWGCLPMWKDNGEYLPLSSNHCSLCIEYVDDEGCLKCPYVKAFKIRCDSREKNNKGHWYNFREKPTLSRANKMVKALESIIKED